MSAQRRRPRWCLPAGVSAPLEPSASAGLQHYSESSSDSWRTPIPLMHWNQMITLYLIILLLISSEHSKKTTHTNTVTNIQRASCPQYKLQKVDKSILGDDLHWTAQLYSQIVLWSVGSCLSGNQRTHWKQNTATKRRKEKKVLKKSLNI